MATTASVHTNTYGGRTITLKVEEISTSIENNTSTVKWTLTSGTSSTYHSVYDITAWVNGTASSNKVYGSKTADWSTRAFPCKDGSTSGTLTIPHNADGTASPVPFRLRGSVYNNNPQNYDGSIDLTTIPRASSFTLSGGTIGSTISVSITRASNTFTHKVYCTYGGKTQVLSNDAGTSASATLDMDFCNYITTSTSASATMFVETYSGGTYVGTTSTQFTMSVPSGVVPTISSVTKSDTSNLLATYGAYVQSKSNLRVQTSASGSYSSTITNIVVNTKDSNNNIIRTLNGSDVTFNGVNYVGTATVEVIITDSRGRQATNTSTINVVGYSNPTISYFTAERLNNDSTVTFTWNASITNINNANANSKSFKIYKRQAGTSSWGSAIFSSTSAYTYTSSGSTNTCDANYGWEFKFEATDSFTTSTFNITIGTAFELMNWKADGTALAIGKVSEHSNTLEVGLTTELNNDVHVGGNVSINDSNNNEVISMNHATGGIKHMSPTIDSGSLNDVDRTRTCTYAVYTPNQSVANCPTYFSDVGFLNVYSWSWGNADWCVQEYYSVNGFSMEKYTRSYHNGGWCEWKSANMFGDTLFDGNTGATLTLARPMTEYKYVEIFYTDENGRKAGSTRIIPEDGKYICLTLTETESGFIVIKSGMWHSNSTQFVCDNHSFTQIFHNGSVTGNNNPDWIHIWRIIGYK